MTDQTPPAVPPLAQTLVHDFAQKGLTVLFTALIGYGAVTPDAKAQFMSLGLGLAAMAASCAWTFAAARLRHNRYLAFLFASPPA